MKRLTFAMPEKVYRKFLKLAAKEKTSMADILREMVVSYCDDTGVK